MEIDFINDALDYVWFVASCLDRFPDEGKITHGKPKHPKKEKWTWL